MSRSPHRAATSVALAIALAVAGTAGCRHLPQPAPNTHPDPTPPPPLRLVVLVVIDQLPSWIFDRDVKLVQDGIARLVRTGVFFPRAELPYSATNTSSGHAALATGTPPATTGILATSWYQRDQHAERSSVDGTGCRVFRLAGAAAEPQSAARCPSSQQLAVDGLADVLRRARGGRALSIAIALKQRAAILALGRRPDLAVWYQPDQGAMTTSSFYAAQPPAWLVDLAEDHPGSALSWAWTPTDPALLARVTGLPDDAPGEANGYDLGTTFPHDLAATGDPAGALRATPMGDQLVLDTALAALAATDLGRDDVPDLLSVSFSSHDWAGHVWGQESWERLDLFLRLDRQIGALLRALDHKVGPDHYAVVLCSDHGATRLVEHSRAHGRPARRIQPSEVIEAANRAARAQLGDGDWIAAWAARNLYVDDRVLALPADRRDAVLDAMVAAVRKVDGIARVFRTDRITGDCDRRDPAEAKACRSVFPGRSGEIYVDYRPDHILTTYPTGTDHGSGNPDDSFVPLVVAVPGRAARTDDQHVSTLRITATLAELLGIPAPPAAVGKPLR